MKRLRHSFALVGLVALGVTLLVGCSDKKNPIAIPNQLPTVQITAAPIDTNAICNPDPQRSCYSITLDWIGNDPDGHIDHYIYAVDPPENPPGQGDTLWIVTTDAEKRLVFKAPNPTEGDNALRILSGKHNFVVAAVDNKGAIGPRADRWFFSFTDAPVVTILTPKPQGQNPPLLPPSVRINWAGNDPDGVFNSKPVRYKYKVLGPADNDLMQTIVANAGPEIRNRYAPDFNGWTEVSGDTTFVRLTNLVPGSNYLFMVVGFDEAGAYSPNFDLGANVLFFRVGYASSFGPKITLFNDFFFYQYTGASYVIDPATEVRIEVPADQPVTFNWFADPPPGADIKAYRWKLDGDVFDQRPRQDEQLDTQFWSAASGVTSATVGPFSGGQHFFYVEAEDNTGLKSLGTIHFSVARATFEKEILVVKDLRLRTDTYRNGVLQPPQGNWPSYAELDTFLYAKGGFPWKGYPAGTVSPTGILNGYPIDTMGTRKGIADLNVSLLTLGKYRRVVWMTDRGSATFAALGTDPANPRTALRYMASPGHLNTLGAYIKQGGEVWVLGGGIGYATTIPYNGLANDAQGSGDVIFSAIRPAGATTYELGPGRFMYDNVKWQTEFTSASAMSGRIERYLGRFRDRPGLYDALPEAMQLRLPSTDPVPPLRSSGAYYPETFSAEALHPPGPSDNLIQEPVLGDPQDLHVDNFEGDAGALKLRWQSSDSLNTVVSQDAVTGAGTSTAAGFAMKIHTAGGGGSLADTVGRDFGPHDQRDWSGLKTMTIAVKQSASQSALTWYVRAEDDRGAAASAPIAPINGTGWQPVTIPGTAFTTDTNRQPNFVHIRKIQFFVLPQLDPSGTPPADTWFDTIDITTEPFASTLDSLMTLANSTVPERAFAPVMTYYHGHDTIKPVLFSGFAPWDFRKTQCVQLFDFVFQKLWGISRDAGANPGVGHSLRASFLPAHDATGRYTSSARAATGGGLRRSLRSSMGQGGR